MKLHHSAGASLAIILHVTTPWAVATSPHQLAFTFQSPQHTSLFALTATVVDDVPSDTRLENPETTCRNRLIALSSTLSSNSATGRFISRPVDKIKLQRAINELESVSPAMGVKEKDLMVGDWSLLVTANVANSDVRRKFGVNRQISLFGKDRSGLSLFGSQGLSLDSLQKTLRKSIEVTQRIRSDSESNGIINRVDNVIEFSPIDTLRDVIPNESPLAFLAEFNLNPLQVKKSKVVLIHKADVESVSPLMTKIAWVSSVLNVAGTSQFFEPEGEDIFGANNPLGEFLNTGTFETVYVDEDIRISRTRGPVFEQLRVFARKDSGIINSEIINNLQAELQIEEEAEVSASTVLTQSSVKKVTGAARNIGEVMTSISEEVTEEVSNALGDAINDAVEKVQDEVENDLNESGESIILEAVGNVTKVVTNIPEEVTKIVDDDIGNVSKSVGEALDSIAKDVQDTIEDDESLIDVQNVDSETDEDDGIVEEN